MKFLLIAAFLSLAAAACRDEERIYKYETQVASGLIPNSPLRSGLKLYAQAHMQFKCGQPEVKVQLRNVVLYKIDQPLVQIKGDFRTIPNEFLKEWIGAEAGKIVEAAQIPFAFQYVEGQVTGLSFDDKDFTIDVKKGFVSLFEVNLKKRLLLEDEPFRASKAIESEHTSEYTVFERSTAGDCATKYFVHPMTVGSKAVMEVNKVRDYSRCLNAPGYSKSPFMEGIEMPDSLKANPLVRSSNIRYSIKGNVEDFIITSAIGEERIIFSPYYAPKDTEEVRTTINQTLVLYGSKRLSEATPIRDVKMSATNKAYHAAQHLKMTIPNSDPKLQDQMPDVIKMSPLSTFRAYPVEKIVSQLMEVAENVQEITSQESVVHMRVVTEMLRTASYADLKQISLELTSPHPRPQTPIHKLAEKVMWTALNHVHTDAAVHFLLDECMTVSSLIQVSSCPWTLTQLVLTATPTPEIITKITEMLKTSVAETPLMKMKLYLTLGSFAYKMNFVNAKRLKELNVAEAMLTPLTKESNDVARNIVTKKLAVITKQKTSIHKISMETSKTVMKIFTDLLEKDNEQDTILALKAIRNSGLRAAVPVLKKFLLDEKFRKRPDFRVLAVLAHCRLADQPIAREEAKNFLVDLLMHTTESNEIRTAAFHVLMNLKPDLPLMEMIAVKMQSEKDLHLTSYVTSYLQSYANSTFAPVMPFSKNATVALKSAPGYTTGIDHAFYTFGGYYNEKHRMGASFELASHGSMDRFMSFDFGLNTVLFGRKATPFSINVATQGMGSLINNMFGAKGIKSLSTLMNLVQSSSGSINPKQFIKQIMDGVNMLPREMKSFNGQVQLNMFGHEVRYFNSIEDIVQFFLPGDKLKFNMAADSIQTALPLDIKTTMYLMDAKLTMPTESGFPVSLQTQITSSMKVNGDVKVKAALPTQMKGVSMFQMLPKKADIGVNVNKKVVLGVYASMGLDCFSIKPTAGFRGIIKVVEPMNTKATVDFASGIVTKEYTIPQQAEPLIETVFEPISEVLIISSTPNVPTVEYTSRPIYASANERITPVAVTLPMPYFGYSLKMIGQSPVQSFYPIPASPLRGRSEMKLSLVPNADAPSVVTIKTKLLTMWNARTTEALKVAAADESSVQVDPIDVTKPITMPMIMKKLLQKAGGKILPKAVNPWDMAVVVTVDASSGAVPRQMQAEYFTHQTDSVDHQHFRMLRLWTSAIPGWTDKQWQLVGEFNVTSPTKVFVPEDIYSINWQKQLANDLEHYMNTPILDSPIQRPKIQSTNSHLKPCLCDSTQKTCSCHDCGANCKRSPLREGGVCVDDYEIEYREDPDNVAAYLQFITGYGWTSMPCPAGTVFSTTECPCGYADESQRIMKSMMNVTMMSISQQLHQPTFNNYVSASKVLDSLMPEMFFAKRLVSHAHEHILSVFSKVQEESQIIVDPSFTNRNTIVIDLIDQLIDAQQEKIFNLTKIVDSAKQMDVEDLVYTQWIVMKNADALLMLKDIVTKYKVSGAITNIQDIKPKIAEGSKRLIVLLKTIEKILLNNKLSYKVSKPGVVEDKIIVAEPLKKLADVHSIESMNVATEDGVISAFQVLCLKQIKELVNIIVKITKDEKVEISPINTLLMESANALSLYDSHIKTKFLEAQPILILTTVQNEFLVKLWQSYINMQVTNFHINRGTYPKAEKKQMIDIGLLTKRITTSFTMRVSQWNKAHKLGLIMEDHEDETMRTMREKLWFVQRNVMTESHAFSDFRSGPRSSINMEEIIKKLIKTIEDNMATIKETVSHIQQLSHRPNVYMTSSVLDAIQSLSRFTSMCRQRLEGNCNGNWCRLSIAKLDGLSTKITEVMATLSPVFEKYAAPGQKTIVKSAVLSSKHLGVELIAAENYYRELFNDIKSGLMHTKSAAGREAVLDDFRAKVNFGLDYVQKILSNPEFRLDSNSKSIITLKLKNILHVLVDGIIGHVSVNMKNEPRLYEGVSISPKTLIEFKDNIVKTIKSLIQQIEAIKVSDVPIKMSAFAPQATSGITGRLVVSWGHDNMMDKKFLMKMFAGRSLEQIMWLVKQLNPAAMSPELVKALTSRMTGQVSVRESFMDVFNSYNHIQMVANFRAQHLPQWVKDYAIAAQETVKFRLWNFYKRHSRPAGTPEGQIVSTIDVSELNNKVDVALMTSGESDVFVNVPLIPAIFKSLKPTQSLRPVSEQFMEYMSGGFSPATCSVHRQHINTLDTVSYTLPQTVTRCRTVLAMDCGADPTFAVTMIPTDVTTGGRVLEIASLNKVVKVTLKDTVTEVKVNDELVTLDQDLAVIEQDVILRKAGRHVEVILPKVGVLVVLDGDIIRIQVPKLFKSRMCGLCSNFDGQRSWEFEGPHQEVYKTQKEFALSYIVPNDVCPASMKPTNFISMVPGGYGYNMVANVNDWEVKGDTQCTAEERFPVKQFRKRKLICFSTDPVTECSFDCDHEKTEINREEITYKCMPRSTITQNLMRKVRRENYMVLESELEGAVKIMKRKATMETNCKA